jgi:hypothetical protein
LQARIKAFSQYTTYRKLFLVNPIEIFRKGLLLIDVSAQVNMKSIIAATLFILAPAISAWTFTYGAQGSQGVSQGTANKACAAIYHPAGSTFEWDRGFFEDCCIRLYADANCQAQVGFSCSDWTKDAS